MLRRPTLDLCHGGQRSSQEVPAKPRGSPASYLCLTRVHRLRISEQDGCVVHIRPVWSGQEPGLTTLVSRRRLPDRGGGGFCDYAHGAMLGLRNRRRAQTHINGAPPEAVPLRGRPRVDQRVLRRHPHLHGKPYTLISRPQTDQGGFSLTRAVFSLTRATFSLTRAVLA